MSDIVRFKTFCLERYKFEHNMKGKAVISLFVQFGVLNYIESFFDVLHTFGDKHIVQDIDLFIEARRTPNYIYPVTN